MEKKGYLVTTTISIRRDLFNRKLFQKKKEKDRRTFGFLVLHKETAKWHIEIWNYIGDF